MRGDIDTTFTPDPAPELETAVLHARVVAAFGLEVMTRRPFWIGGVPTDLDMNAARLAVARRLRLSIETVVEVLSLHEPRDEV